MYLDVSNPKTESEFNPSKKKIESNGIVHANVCVV